MAIHLVMQHGLVEFEFLPYSQAVKPHLPKHYQASIGTLNIEVNQTLGASSDE